MGGIERFVDQLARGVVAAGEEVDILHLSREAAGPPLVVAGYRVHRAQLDFEIAGSGFSMGAFGKFETLVREADVIHCHFPWPFADLVCLVTRPRAPIVLTYHSDIVKQEKLMPIYRPLMELFLSRVRRIVATSPNYSVSSKVLQRYSSKVSVVPIGLDKNTYPLPSEDCKTRWRDMVSDRFFLFVGILRYYKGLHTLLEAVKSLQCRVVIAGAGPEESSLREKAEKLGLSNVIFLGQVSDLEKATLLSLCYGVVFPSHLRAEAFGVSLLEGAMYGKPMISSEIGTGTSFVNVSGLTGLVVPPSDPTALRAAMEYLLNNPSIARDMGISAAERHRQLFTAEHMVKGYMDIYRSLL